MQATIQNEFLSLTVDTHGAEAVSLKNALLGRRCLCPRCRIFRVFSPCRCRPGRRLCLGPLHRTASVLIPRPKVFM